MKELEALLKRIEALEDRVRLLEYQLAPQEEESSNHDERHFCAILDCDQPVDEDGALCSGCQACEELQPDDDFARQYEQAKREGDRLFGSGQSS